MRFRALITLLALAGIAGCSGTQTATSPSPTPTPTPAPATKRLYNGTASRGDFLNITIDTAAGTFTYTNLSNGDSGTASFTTNADGTYTLNDPSGNLTAAYEVPGYALLIEAQKTGPNKDTPALITAVESASTSMAMFASNNDNYIQFRTSSGGLEVGSVSVAATSAQVSSYWPFGALSSSNSPFNNHPYDLSQAAVDSSGTFLKNPSAPPGTGYDYIFGTVGGFFIVDTGNGSLLGLQKAATKDFDPTVAGTYNAIYYEKTGAQTGQNNTETGTPSLNKATIVIDAAANVTVTNPAGVVLTQTKLAAVADTSYLYGSAGQLQDPCNGLFTFRITTPTSQQDVFVSFVKNAVVFASFKANLPWTQSNGTYDYLYGVGLK